MLLFFVSVCWLFCLPAGLLRILWMTFFDIFGSIYPGTRKIDYIYGCSGFEPDPLPGFIFTFSNFENVPCRPLYRPTCWLGVDHLISLYRRYRPLAVTKLLQKFPIARVLVTGITLGESLVFAVVFCSCRKISKTIKFRSISRMA